jgi:flagella basal body P-ring formation protein FlgA
VALSVKRVRTARVVVLVFAAGLVVSSMASAKTRITLSEDDVVTTERFYTLGDIASLEAPAGQLARQLLRTRIGRSPRPGYLAHVTRHQVAARLEQAAPGIHRQIEWRGAGFVRIRAGGLSYDAQTYIGPARGLLEEQLASHYERFELKAVGRPKDIVLPAGRVTVQPTIKEPFVLNKRISVWVDLLVDGEHFRSIPVWFDVSVWQDALVAVRAIDAESAVEPADLALAHRDIAAVRGVPVTSDAQLDGKRLKRRISKGHVLTLDALESVPAVAKGQQVNVRAIAGRVSIGTSAIAMADGQENDRIWVRKPDSNETYSVVVVGKGMAVADGRKQ